MDIQVPEPEYYTLAEVAERWEVSGDVLLRLGAEKKLIFAWPVLSGFRICHDFLGGCLRTAEEVEQLFPSLRPGQLLFRVNPEAKAIEIVMGGLAYLKSYSLRPFSRLHNGVIFSAGFSRVSHFINNEQGEHYMTMMGELPPLPAPYHFSACIPVRTSHLVIPTSEIHRIEHQREAAQKAADDDILGTTERETMQAVIAAMAQFIADSAPKYQNGKNPNALQIAKLLDPMIPNRTDEGIRKTIGNAIKAGLTVKP